MCQVLELIHRHRRSEVPEPLLKRCTLTNDRFGRDLKRPRVDCVLARASGLPRLDQALAALITDLKERGLMDNTLLVVTGEFGRTPKVLTQQPPGRQHWPKCFSSIMAGAGIGGGRVYGKSDRHGAYVTRDPIRPEELAATIYHALDIPINDPTDTTGLARSLTTGKPVMDLFG